jgi:chemotaxis protein MotB
MKVARQWIWGTAVVCALTGACASRGDDSAVKSADDARTACDQQVQVRARTDRTTIENLEVALRAAEARVKAADSQERVLLSTVDEKTVLSNTLRGELQHTGDNEILYKDLALRLRSVVDTGDLSIVVRRGQMTLRLPNDVLFDSGSVELKPAGKRTLAYIATALGSVTGRRFQVAGNTDAVPIQSSRFPSNWELSTARAVRVVRFLVVDGGLNPALLSAAGYGEFDPVAPNDVERNRIKNRRIEITLQPDVKELVAVPDRY